MKQLLSPLSFIFCFLLLTAESCDDNSVQHKEEAKKSKNVQSIMQKQPATALSFSMDRYLLDTRNVRLNDPNKMVYLYICFLDGTWLKLTIIGKVASTSKRLTSPEEYLYEHSESHYGSSPDDMGTWGSSEPAKVGLSTIGSLIEYGGMLSYIYSETPLTFTNFNKPIVEVNIVATPEQKTEFLKSLEALKKLK